MHTTDFELLEEKLSQKRVCFFKLLKAYISNSKLHGSFHDVSIKETDTNYRKYGLEKIKPYLEEYQQRIYKNG